MPNDLEPGLIQSEIAQVSFEYSPVNPPPLDVLRSKVFAVHSTPILPKNGTLKAGARNIGYNEHWENEPPTFRPTIHFALGEIVPQHMDWSWDKHPYALVTPLGEIEDQLVNIFTHDSFVLGNIALKEGMVLLVPSGTDISQITADCEIREYQSVEGLRNAVDSVIGERGGWHIRMQPQGGFIGSVAYIDDKDINEPAFFSALFQERPYISFGSHDESEKGEAYRFGAIEEATNIVSKTYDQSGPPFSTPKLALYRSYILHNLNELEEALGQSNIASKAWEAFEEKKQKLQGWINIIDCDLDIRRRLGKTLNRLPDALGNEVKQRRDNPAALKQWADEHSTILPDAFEGNDLYPDAFADMLKSFSRAELKEFIDDNEEFLKIDLADFFIPYAVSRWMLLKTDKAREEGLDKLLENALKLKIQSKSQRADDGIIKSLGHFLSEDSNRLTTALEVFREPYVQKYLTERHRYIFRTGGPSSLRDLLIAHPFTRILFEQRNLNLSENGKEIYALLDLLGQVYLNAENQEREYSSFLEARSLASGERWARERLLRNVESASKPMNSARELEEIPVGGTLNLYELLRRDNSDAGQIWQRVGLGKEFRTIFPTDEDFWSSNMSIIEIYKMLKQKAELSSVNS